MNQKQFDFDFQRSAIKTGGMKINPKWYRENDHGPWEDDPNFWEAKKGFWSRRRRYNQDPGESHMRNRGRGVE